MSWNGKLFAYAIAQAGSDWDEWRVRDIATGKDSGEVIENALLLRIPTNLATGQDGDQTEIARRGRTQGDFGRSNGAPASPDTIEEVAMMARRTLQMDLVRPDAA